MDKVTFLSKKLAALLTHYFLQEKRELSDFTVKTFSSSPEIKSVLMSTRDLGSEADFLKFQRKKNLPEYSIVINNCCSCAF